MVGAFVVNVTVRQMQWLFEGTCSAVFRYGLTLTPSAAGTKRRSCEQCALSVHCDALTSNSSIFALSLGESGLAVELLQLFDVHPPMVLAEFVEEHENIFVG